MVVPDFADRGAPALPNEASKFLYSEIRKIVRFRLANASGFVSTKEHSVAWFFAKEAFHITSS
jgi:hypothetical protein